MTDVVRETIPGMAQNTGGAFVYSPGIQTNNIRSSGETNANCVQPPNIIQPFPVSGVNASDNGYLDDRFDDVDYYTA